MKQQIVFFLVLGIGIFPDVTAIETQEYFTDTPPVDYFHRKSLADCPSRFYADRNKYTVYTGYAFGGQRALSGEFQHMTAIGWTTGNVTKYLCGGTLISSKFILTAAHCIVSGDGKAPDTVRLGDTNLATEENDELAQQINIRRFRIHPEYRGSRKYFDIALLELETDVTFSDAVCPACLWLEKDLPSETMSAVGFGALGYGEDLSPTLQKVRLSVIHKSECLNRLPAVNRSLPRGLVDDQFCAGSDTMDTCEGDSGGPIETERADVSGQGYPLVVGIVSFGSPCGLGSTGVYTKIASYLDWIEKEVGRPMNYLACTRTTFCSVRKKINTNISVPPEKPVHRMALIWDLADHNKLLCGATLIDYRYAVTSAYCAQTMRGPPKYIGLDDNTEIVPIESIYVHPDYQLGNPQNDIALIKLSKYLNTENSLLPACLWREEEISNERSKMYYSVYSSELTRWDRIPEFKPIRNVIETEIDNNGMCAKLGYGYDNIICANNSIDLIPTVCKMDYGGPVSNVAFSMYLPYVYGVVSSLSQSCSENLVGTRISPHVQWIESVVLDHSSDRLIFAT